MRYRGTTPMVNPLSSQAQKGVCVHDRMREAIHLRV